MTAIALPSQIQDDQEFANKMVDYLGEILGQIPKDEECFEICEDNFDLGAIIIKGTMSYTRFKTHFKPDHVEGQYGLTYTLYYDETGLEFETENFTYISTTPEALEINRILDRATKIPNVFELLY